MRSSALPGTMLGNGPQAPFINGSFSTRRLGISIRPAAVPCMVTAICLGAKRPAVLGMNMNLPATLDPILHRLVIQGDTQPGLPGATNRKCTHSIEFSGSLPDCRC